MEVTNRKAAKIEYTMKNSVPLFVYLLIMFIAAKSTVKDFFETKKEKRSILKSTVKQYHTISKFVDPQIVGKHLESLASNIKKLA